MSISNWPSAGSASGPVRQEFFKDESWEEGDYRITRTTVTVAGQTMTETTRRDRDLDTVWTTEHLLKDTDDLKAYLKIPDEAFVESVDVSPLEAEEAELGEKGIVMVDTEDPLCAAAALFSMEDYTIIALTEPACSTDCWKNTLSGSTSAPSRSALQAWSGWCRRFCGLRCRSFSRPAQSRGQEQPSSGQRCGVAASGRLANEKHLCRIEELGNKGPSRAKYLTIH